MGPQDLGGMHGASAEQTSSLVQVAYSSACFCSCRIHVQALEKKQCTTMVLLCV